jgi:hypothetical protein
VVWVTATPQGEELAEAARSFRRGIMVERLTRLDERQQHALTQALELLEDVVADPHPAMG